MDWNALFGNLVFIVGALGFFSFLAIASWTDARRREREALYRSEAIKKLTEMQGTPPDSVLDLVRGALAPEKQPDPTKMIMMWFPGQFRREQESNRRRELLKQLMSMPGATSESAFEFLREEDRRAEQRRRDWIRLAGMITAAAGVGMLIFLRAVITDMPFYLAALVPILVGIVLTAFASVQTGRPSS